MLKRLFEWYLGVPPVQPGQGTAWRFEWSRPFPGWMPNWLAVLLVAAVVAAVCGVYWRDARRASVGRRWAFVALRLGVLALVTLFLTRMRLSIERTGLPTVVVLIDDSSSTQLEDLYDASQARALADLVGDAAFEGAGDLRRTTIARALLLADDGRLPRALLERHKLRVYRFSGGISPLGRSEYVDERELDELFTGLRDLRADGSATRPGPAVKDVLEELRGAPPSAIIVLTDGVSTTGDGDRLSSTANLARDRVVPIFVVGLGREEPARDLQLYDLLVDEVAFVNDPITFTAKLKAAGVEGDDVELLLRDEATGEVLKRSRVPVPPEKTAAAVELTYTPPQEGRFQYTLAVEPLPHETNRENNAETRTVSVRSESIRVLLVDGVPRFEFKYVKALLERERTVELHTVLQDADLEYATDDATALDHFPVRREELAKYDVIVFGDVDPRDLSPAALANLEEFVAEEGGGLLFVAGRFFNPLAYRDGPLAKLFPIDLDTATAPPLGATITEGFRPRLTPAGRQGSAIFRFAESEAESTAIWNGLPELYWMIAAPETSAGAIVLAERSPAGGVGESLPVVVVQQFGEGKVLFQATDDLWLWRKFTGDAIYGRYWVQTIRYLSRSRLLGGEGKVELTTDRRTYQQGDTVTVRVRFRDESLIPRERNGVTVMVEREGSPREPLRLTRLPRAPSLFEGRLPRAASGAYHLLLTRPIVPGEPASWDYRVEAPDAELARTALDRADLVLTAERTHGRYYDAAEARRLADDVPRGNPVRVETREPIPLWNRPELLVVFTLLLLGEWLLRKRERLV